MLKKGQIKFTKKAEVVARKVFDKKKAFELLQAENKKFNIIETEKLLLKSLIKEGHLSLIISPENGLALYITKEQQQKFEKLKISQMQWPIVILNESDKKCELQFKTILRTESTDLSIILAKEVLKIMFGSFFKYALKMNPQAKEAIEKIYFSNKKIAKINKQADSENTNSRDVKPAKSDNNSAKLSTLGTPNLKKSAPNENDNGGEGDPPRKGPPSPSFNTKEVLNKCKKCNKNMSYSTPSGLCEECSNENNSSGKLSDSDSGRSGTLSDYDKLGIPTSSGSDKDNILNTGLTSQNLSKDEKMKIRREKNKKDKKTKGKILKTKIFIKKESSDSLSDNDKDNLIKDIEKLLNGNTAEEYAGKVQELKCENKDLKEELYTNLLLLESLGEKDLKILKQQLFEFRKWAKPRKKVRKSQKKWEEEAPFREAREEFRRGSALLSKSDLSGRLSIDLLKRRYKLYKNCGWNENNIKKALFKNGDFSNEKLGKMKFGDKFYDNAGYLIEQFPEELEGKFEEFYITCAGNPARFVRSSNTKKVYVCNHYAKGTFTEINDEEWSK